MKTIYKFFRIILLFFLFSCTEKTQNTEYNFSDNGFFVVNEGNFTYGNASLSFIDLNNDTIYNNVFKNASSYPLGDVAQNLTLWNNLAFVVINNSGKIFVIDNTTAKYIATIKNLTSPRQILIKDKNTAYVSDLYSNYISIVNPSTYELEGTISIGCSSENLLLVDNYLFVTSWNQNNKIIKINTLDNSVIGQLEVNYQPNSIVKDKNGMLWVLSDGGMDPDTNNNVMPALTEINPDNFTIVKTIEFESKTSSPTHLLINANGDVLYFLNSSWSQSVSNGGVFKMNISEEKIPSSSFIAESGRLFYSLGISPNEDIIISDAIDYAQNGVILIYSSTGNLKQTFKAGIIPGYFKFKE